MSPDGLRSGPLPGPAGRIASTLYAREISRRNRAFDAGLGVTRLDRPVISVGNLSVGGTGKTPVVMRLAGALRVAGHRPCIAMRGYKAGTAGSDEAQEYRARLEGVPIVAQPNRLAGLRALFASVEGRGVDVVLLDDGFQHRSLARDLDIVLIDATRNPFGDRLLPAGYLREGPQSLERAHAAVITHAESVSANLVSALDAQLRSVKASLEVSIARHAWEASMDGADRGGELNGEARVLVVCAIGNPAPFVEAAGSQYQLAGEPIVLKDHHPFGPAAVSRIIRQARAAGADAILTTAKDWSKLRMIDPARWPCPVIRPRLEIAFDRGWDALHDLVLRAASASSAPVAFES